MTAALKPAGRTLAEFQPLKPAEEKLLSACRQGVAARISEKRPEAASDDNTVRAAFLRFLALGGDELAPVHEHGVELFGAWIEGKLDMKAARVPSDLIIGLCHFDSTPPYFVAQESRGRLILAVASFPALMGIGLFARVVYSCAKASPPQEKWDYWGSRSAVTSIAAVRNSTARRAMHCRQMEL